LHACKADVKNALSLVLAPVEMPLNVDGDFIKFVKNRLVERTFTEGDTTPVAMLGQTIRFTVVKARPCGIVKMTPDTNLQILAKPLDVMRATIMEYRKERERYRFRCLKGMEREYAADYILFVIPEQNNRERCEGKIISIVRALAHQEEKIINIRVELWDERGIIDPQGFPWAKVSPMGKIEYTYPIEWAKVVNANFFTRWKTTEELLILLDEDPTFNI